MKASFKTWLIALALLSWGAHCPGAAASHRRPLLTPPDLEPKVEIEPAAMALVKAMTDRLAAAKTMSFTAVATYESPDRTGMPLAYFTQSQVTLQRPDKLRVITPGDGPRTEFYYDGKTVQAYSPPPISWRSPTRRIRPTPCCAPPSRRRRSTFPSPT